MTTLRVPAAWHRLEFEDRAGILAENNQKVDLRREIEDIVGLEHKDCGSVGAGQFTNEEMAALVIALGGPHDPEEVPVDG